MERLDTVHSGPQPHKCGDNGINVYKCLTRGPSTKALSEHTAFWLLTIYG